MDVLLMLGWVLVGKDGPGTDRRPLLGYALSSRLHWEAPMDRHMDCCWMDGSTVCRVGRQCLR